MRASDGHDIPHRPALNRDAAAECSKRFRSNSGHPTGALGPEQKFV
jgi:hypothetical protein